MDKIVIYIDMDDTIVDFISSYKKVKDETGLEYPQSKVGFFEELPLIEGARDVILWLDSKDIFDVYILTAPSIKNKHCYTEKAISIENNFGHDMLNKLIISPNKGLNKGNYLIDDYIEGKGQENFEGELITIGSEKFKGWQEIKEYFKQKYELGD